MSLNTSFFATKAISFVFMLMLGYASCSFGPSRFVARVLFYQEASSAVTGTLMYDWEAQEQRFDITVFEKSVTEISLFKTRHGAIKFTTIDNQCSAQVTESHTQDILFVSDVADVVGETSACGDLIPPFADNPPKPPLCIQYRQDIGDLTFLLTWDSANQVVRQAQVTRQGRSLRRYIFLSQTHQTNPFPSNIFSPDARCRGSVFCPQSSAFCIAIDGSESISPTEFSAAKQFARRLVEQSQADSACLITFSHTSYIDSGLVNVQSLVSTINKISRRSGLTDLASPLTVSSTLLSESSALVKSLVLLSDGQGTFAGPSSKEEASERLRNQGVQVYTVALGDGRNDTALRKLAYHSSSAYHFSARNLNSLPDLRGASLEGSCDTSIRQCSSVSSCGEGFPLCVGCLCPNGRIAVSCDDSVVPGISQGAIVGIVLAVLGVLALAALGGWFLYRRLQPAPGQVAAPIINQVNDNPLYQGPAADNYNPLYQPGPI